MDALSWIERLIEKAGTEEFLSWAKDNRITPTYNDALYWLVKVKGMTGEIRI
jgi:hypothetical protein